MVDRKTLAHIGVARRSGRYPWGSGDDGYQHTGSLKSRVKELEKAGMTQVEIANALGLKNTNELRKNLSIEKAETRDANRAMAIRLREKGWSKTAIGERMGVNESTVRSWLDEDINARNQVLKNTSKTLKEAVDKDGYIQIGVGVEAGLGISRTKLLTSVKVLEDEGYTVHTIPVLQQGTGKYTQVQVLAPPGTEKLDVIRNKDKIAMLSGHFEDGGRVFEPNRPPKNIDSNRIHIRYDEDGGSLKDGVVELRRGVEDLSLGASRYAQVRIAVEGTHYLKGMAIYSDDIPDGYDISYNTNKKRGTDKYSVFKPMQETKEGSGIIDPENPFKASVRQKFYIDKNGEKQQSALNIVGTIEGAGEEGAWRKWSKTLSSQVLSKQPPAIAKKQLDIAYEMRKEEFDEIMQLTNPSVRAALLKPFADSCDAAAVHLKAAALPRQASHVLLPVDGIKENEVYAPNYRHGENVVLIRHPHGGIFEIPELKVNNNNRSARSIMGGALDAVGINPKVAQKLSGADFDGDTVLVIPNPDPRRGIQTAPSLKALKDFDAKKAYPGVPGMKVMKHTDQEMGNISNLITDMTIKGASGDDIARAVKHSMVVIDAKKHGLNYKLSYQENGIAQLKAKYQGSSKSGASTLVSKAKSEERIDEIKEGIIVKDPITGRTKKLYIDPSTGEKLFRKTGRTYIDKATGKVVTAKTKTTKMAIEKDARKLSSGTEIEGVYADYANSVKALANKARKAMVSTSYIPYSPSARKTFSKEVASLRSKLTLAFKNKPKERQAQILASSQVAAKKKANPDMDKDELKKLKWQSLERARLKTGAKKDPIEITDSEWRAIQAGAISKNQLALILQNADLKAIRERATPRTWTSSISPARMTRARTMITNGSTNSEIADALGVSVSTLIDALEKS